MRLLLFTIDPVSMTQDTVDLAVDLGAKDIFDETKIVSRESGGRRRRYT